MAEQSTGGDGDGESDPSAGRAARGEGVAVPLLILGVLCAGGTLALLLAPWDAAALRLSLGGDVTAPLGLVLALLALLAGASLVSLLIVGRQYVAARERARRAGAAAQAAEVRFRALVQNASDVVLVVSIDTTVDYASPSAARVFGTDPASLAGHRLAAWVHEEDRTRALVYMSELAAHAGDALATELRLRVASDDVRTVECVGTNLLAEPTVHGLVLTLRDVTERRALEARLLHQAFHDPLTGLANRALFRDRVGHALERAPRRQHTVGVLFIDLDDFKTVNDSLGHALGDRLLVATAGRLARCSRTSDTIARLGGDEFAILVEDAPGDDELEFVAQRVTAAFDEPLVVDGQEFRVSTSIGVAHARPEDGSAEDVLRNADVAMYFAKSHGKGRYAVFQPEMHERIVQRLEMEADLRRALERNELALHYQPIVRLSDGHVIGTEALLRWHRPGHGIVAPMDFIPLAEETGLIMPIGRWVLHEACRQAQMWQARHRDRAPRMAVNVSGRHLREPQVVDDLRDALAASGLLPALLTIEITESVLMEQSDEIVARLHELKALGVSLAIDDFGTGYSSLSYLQRFPVDVLKIDKAFVDEVGHPTLDAPLARAIIGLAETLQLRTVAEGVELAGQVSGLRDLGCELAQGFHFSRPVLASVIDGLMTGAPLTPSAGTMPVAG